MALALFDLDHTLLDGDSDHLWGEYLCDLGAVDAAAHRAENARHFRDYTDGRLDLEAFLRASLGPLALHPRATLERWRAAFVHEIVRPLVPDGARELLATHRARGDTLVIVTTTQRFISGPIATLLGVPHLLATEPELVDGRYTGRVAGEACYREGKVRRVEAFIATHGGDLADASFHSDSHNDLPLLERVARPCAVNADAILARVAAARGWPTLSLRSTAGAARLAARLAAAGA